MDFHLFSWDKITGLELGAGKEEREGDKIRLGGS